MELLRRVIVGACLTVAAGAASSAGAQTQQQIDWCVNSDTLSADLSIGGCTAAIQSGPWSGKDLARTSEHRCWTYPNKTETDWAIADCTEAIHLDTNIGVFYLARGRTYESKGDFDRAIADFNEAIRLNPNYADAYVDRGGAYSNKDDYDRAIADFDEAIRLNPNYADAYHSRGIAYRNTGDYDRAFADLNEARRLQPN